MGVINITPDSFSDGGDHNSAASFASRVFQLAENCSIIDIGAESTAPFNDPISPLQELDRYKKILFPMVLDKQIAAELTISIDSYRFDTFRQVLLFFRDNKLGNNIIWNDISGILNDELLENLSSFTSKENYIYSHSLVPSRNQASDHMEFISNRTGDSFLEEIIEYFQMAYYRFSGAGIMDKVIFDPCFGFSKTKEQNHYLIANLQRLLLALPASVRWTLGISRKSFLRFLPAEDENLILQTEYLQSLILSRWMPLSHRNTLFFRLHDPLLAETICSYLHCFNAVDV